MLLAELEADRGVDGEDLEPPAQPTTDVAVSIVATAAAAARAGEILMATQLLPPWLRHGQP
ncbi:MAG: hypothetical protein ACXVYA_09325 [Mycobacterium sp.]